MRSVLLTAVALLALAAPSLPTQPAAEPAKVRCERQCQIRRDKLDRILPSAPRDNGVGIWIVMRKEK
jgi:hypothetical protein